MAAEGRTYCARCGTALGPGAFFCPHCGTSISQARDHAVAIAPHRPSDAARDALLEALRRATLGEYEILAEVGRGGMATVYLAHDLALDRKVAIKVPAPALLAMGEGMVQRFKREARTAAALSHPHIIPIYTVKQSDDVLYFVMKYVPGRALDTIIREIGPVPIPMVQTILAHVADALGYAHRHGVIHRDIKSANIMLDDEGGAVVTDFGIAKVVASEGLTMTGVTVGTPVYMSPEQCATLEITGASDQYSLGIVAYEMLTGHPPFRSESTMAVMYAHFNETPRPVTELRPDCPPNLALAVMRMLEKEPAKRWATMDDVVAVCGRLSLRHDDPVRSQMITLAKAGGQSQLLGTVVTPTSPIAPVRPARRAPARRRLRRLWWALGASGVVAAGWWVAPWRLLRLTPPAAGPDTAAAALARGTPAAESLRVEPAPETPTDPAPGPGARGPERRPVVPPAATESASRVAAAQRDDSIVGSLRTTALAAMRQAAAAGALAADLARGDTVFREAESLAAAGRASEALVQLATATSLWREAERAARNRPADTGRPAAPPPPPVTAEAPADPRPLIERVMAAYADALETRDLSRVRQAYAGLTAAQETGWREFFPSVRNLRVTLTLAAVSIVGDSAEVTVGGLYEYDNATTGRPERRPVNFRATLSAQAGEWRLTRIR